MEVVKLEKVTFSYDGVSALKNISFSFNKGDFIGVVGPNGSGKSTLLKIIDGILIPEKGNVLFKGKPVKSYSRRDLAREIALVPQNFNLDFSFTVSEVVKMGRYSWKGEKEFIFNLSSLLDKLEIGHLEKRLFPQLSGGEKQMVVLAQALAQRPELLLLDEPASHLDVSYQLKLFQFLKQVNQEGITIFCVTHDLNLALFYFKKLLLLSEGKIVSFGRAEDVLNSKKIDAVYGVKTFVHRHAGRIFLTFSPRYTGEERAKIHVICGGGTGSFLLRKLVDLGFRVSVGAINALDTDEVTGRELGLPMAVEAPFTSLTDKVFEENLRLLKQADLVILTDVPLGFGNIKNLKAIEEAVKIGKPVWAIKGIEERDFTGKAKEITPNLSGISYFSNIEEMVEKLRKWEK